MVLRALMISAVVVAAMSGLSIWAWTVTPADAQIPVHWSATGEVNRYGSRFEAFWMMPILAAGLSLLLAVAPQVDPRGRNLKRSGPVLPTIWYGVLAILFVAHLTLVFSATGVVDPDGGLMLRLLLIVLSVFMMMLGNLLGKTRPNWFVGVRTPWTLSSDRSWDITHRWAGRGFVLTGAASAVAMIVAPVEVAVTLLLILLATTGVAALVISYFAWRSDPDRETFNEAAD